MGRKGYNIIHYKDSLGRVFFRGFRGSICCDLHMRSLDELGTMGRRESASLSVSSGTSQISSNGSFIVIVTGSLRRSHSCLSDLSDTSAECNLNTGDNGPLPDSNESSIWESLESPGFSDV